MPDARVLESAQCSTPSGYIIARLNPARTSSPTSSYCLSQSIPKTGPYGSGGFMAHFDKGVENVYERTRTNQAP